MAASLRLCCCWLASLYIVEPLGSHEICQDFMSKHLPILAYLIRRKSRERIVDSFKTGLPSGKGSLETPCQLIYSFFLSFFNHNMSP